MAGNVNRRELYFCISANVFEYLNNPGNLSLQRSVTAWTAARWLWLINLFHRVASLADLAKWHRRWLFQKAGFLAFLFGDQTRNRSAGCWVGMVSRFFTASDVLMVLRNHKIGGWHISVFWSQETLVGWLRIKGRSWSDIFSGSTWHKPISHLSSTRKYVGFFSNLSAPRVSWSYESPGCLFGCEVVAVSGQKCLIMGATHAAVESVEPKCPLQNY